MSSMFYGAGVGAESFEIIGLENWNTSQVTDMSFMFVETGVSAEYDEIDLTGWDVDNVSNYDGFNENVETKILAPIWRD